MYTLSYCTKWWLDEKKLAVPLVLKCFTNFPQYFTLFYPYTDKQNGFWSITAKQNLE